MFPPDQQRPLPQKPLNDEQFRRFAEEERRWAADWRRENLISDAWLHWEYSQEEWARFEARDYRPGRRWSGPLLVLLAGLAVGAGLVATNAALPGAVIVGR